MILQQQEEKRKFIEARGSHDAIKEEVETTGFFGNAFGKIKQQFFGEEN